MAGQWREQAGKTGAVARWRGFSSPETLPRTLLPPIARGHSSRETAVRAKLANWADVSDVALRKRLRNSQEWLRALCADLLAENPAAWKMREGAPTLRVVDGTIVPEPGKTGSQWRIVYSLELPGLAGDFFGLSPAVGLGHGESLSRLPVGVGRDS